MKMNISEFAKFTGVSVRTLHYYDEIGLLKPDFIDCQNGYRFYGVAAAKRMQEILFYRELDFSLKDIKRIISSSDYNKHAALNGQKQLLILERQYLDKIIQMLDCVAKGEKIMNFDAFDKSEINEYKDEVKQRWGKTHAYKEQQKKTAKYTKNDWHNISNELNKIINNFSEIKNTCKKPNSINAYLMVEKLKTFITETQYKCTNEILSSLGEMYISDQRFKNNIDKAGEGTAEFISNVIKHYCKIN